ncbi:undecaprenyldiphospho-muramoylpentapeptide beta-N- acetylglucosaminyltransferase [Staphylococcus epidermidis]|nr:undecaprenyldiphospho-muramoylpentapeptide beta-N- acetylglucosaminyltransferase [Staphylococcus epidermidis]
MIIKLYTLTGKGLVDDSINKKGYVQFEFVKDDLTDLLAITDTVVKSCRF